MHPSSNNSSHHQFVRMPPDPPDRRSGFGEPQALDGNYLVVAIISEECNATLARVREKWEVDATRAVENVTRRRGTVTSDDPA
jgi:hypothetical protein